MADVEGDALVAEAVIHRERELGVFSDGVDIGRLDAFGHVQRAGLEVGVAHGGVDDGAVDDAVDFDGGGVPVAVEALEGDVVLGDAFDELVGAGADRLVREVLAGGLGGLGGDDHAGTVGQRREEGGGGGFEDHPHRERVNHLDAIEGGDFAAPGTARHGEVAFHAEFDGRGVEIGAVMEFHAGAQLEDEGFAVGPCVGGGELGDDVQVGVDVDELVAQPGEDDAPDEGAAKRGVEQVGVIGEADAQRRAVLGKGGQRGQHKGGEGGGEQGGSEQRRARHGDPLGGRRLRPAEPVRRGVAVMCHGTGRRQGVVKQDVRQSAQALGGGGFGGGDGGVDLGAVIEAAGAVAAGEEGAEGGVALAADGVEAAQFGERIGMVVGTDVEVGVGVVGADLEGGGLFAALVAAGGFAGFEGGEEAFGHGAGAGAPGRQGVGDDIGAGQHVAGDADVMAGEVSGPGDAGAAGELGDAALCIQYEQLPVFAPGIGSEQGGREMAGRLAQAQARHAVDGIHRVDQRLRRQSTDAALDMNADGADGEETGGHGGAECAGGGIASEDGPGHGGN